MSGVYAILIAYVLGAIPFGYLLVKWTSGRDVRAVGSGNIGATNVVRAAGRLAGIATLALDIGKGFVAVWVAGRLTGLSPWWMSAAALAVMVGHAFPVFLGFKGGKAVASAVGAFACLTPGALAALLPVFVVVVAVTRYISMGSIVSAACLPLAVWLLAQPPAPVFAASVAAGAFIIWRHKSNIERLRAGTEHVFSFGSRRS
ncbi:MAG: glycerol-3-phosphate 1-O-acyltransferase PlsY [Bryobacterales bacterium]|nr:glycerol-3-phosphate 1-O-acyltransferase PlsY [Bryobacteraceae bacterium]MDW8356121.1 glycerol-3-phosphate 1-O-acyltransferase PlsY [Bryobacterales bacterium]